jgi:hypothetical protein
MPEMLYVAGGVVGGGFEDPPSLHANMPVTSIIEITAQTSLVFIMFLFSR